MKTYYLVEVDTTDESVIEVSEIRGVITAMLEPIDAHDPAVVVREMSDVVFSKTPHTVVAGVVVK